MPSYEMPLVIRKLARPEVATILKRVATTIFDNGGIIQKLENLGTRQTPYKIRQHGFVLKEASYFLFEFNSSPAVVYDIIEATGRDVDVMRCRIYKTPTSEKFECTFEDECLPPAYRKEVQKMVEIAKQNEKPKFKSNTGLDYYPFNK